MVTLGADTHKASHTIVAVDELGRSLGETTVAATEAGHRTLIAWAAQFPERRFALEDVRHLSRRLEADLIRAGERVVRVPTRLMGRRGVRDASGGSPMPSTPWPRPGRRCGNLVCPRPPSKALNASCVCSWTTGRTTSASAPGWRIACSGTSTNFFPAMS